MLPTLNREVRDTPRRVQIHDQADRDAIASDLLRSREGRGDDWADIIDMLTMYPEARQKVVRLLGEIEASNSRQDAHPCGGTGQCSCSPACRPWSERQGPATVTG